MRRLRSLESLRGLGVMLMVFLHAALYQFGGIMEVDLSNPPLVATLIGFALMWGGLFALLSGATHAIRSVERLQNGVPLKTVRRWELLGGVGYVVLGIVYFAPLGPTLIDVAAGTHDASPVISLIGDGTFRLPSASRLFYMNTLFMVGFGTLLASPLFAWLARHGDPRSLRVFAGVAAAASTVLALSWLRIPLYPVFEQAMRDGELRLVFATFWLVNKHDPLLPSLGLTLLGTLTGLVIVSEQPRHRRRLALGLGAALLVAGIVGWISGPSTMLRRTIDETWYSIALAQAGCMLIGVVLVHCWLDTDARSAATPGLVQRVFHRFSHASLSVLFAETVLAECAGKGLTAVAPGWNRTLTAAVLFGIAMTVLWALALVAWERRGYPWSIERGWVRSMRALGRPSTGLDA